MGGNLFATFGSQPCKAATWSVRKKFLHPTSNAKGSLGTRPNLERWKGEGNSLSHSSATVGPVLDVTIPNYFSTVTLILPQNFYQNVYSSKLLSRRQKGKNYFSIVTIVPVSWLIECYINFAFPVLISKYGGTQISTTTGTP